MAEMTEVAARKYGRLIEAMDTLYANSTGAQKEWIDNNWKSILDGMVERGEEMIQGWKGEPEVEIQPEKKVKSFQLWFGKTTDGADDHIESFDTYDEMKEAFDNYVLNPKPWKNIQSYFFDDDGEEVGVDVNEFPDLSWVENDEESES